MSGVCHLLDKHIFGVHILDPEECNVRGLRICLYSRKKSCRRKRGGEAGQSHLVGGKLSDAKSLLEQPTTIV